MRISLVLCTLLLALAGGGGAHGQEPVGSSGDRFLVEVRPPTSLLVERGLDIWEVTAERTLVLAFPDEIEPLRADGFDVTVVRSFPANRRRAAAASFGPGTYRGHDAVVAEMRAIGATYPAIVSLRDLGPSWETSQRRASRRIWAARVTGPGSSLKPAVLFISAYHAREVVTPELGLRALRAFAEGYGRDPLLTYLVDTREIWIVPMANPDGYARVEAGAEWWRKNVDAGVGACGAAPGTAGNSRHPGVDLNRNHTFEWNAGGGASTDPCAETYQGTAPASEPETRAIQALVESVQARALVSWHAYGNVVLWPWGHRAESRGADPRLDALGSQLARVTGYGGGPAGSTLYLTTGDLTDWAWGARGVPAFTIEVGAYSDGVGGNPFTPAYGDVERYWSQNRAAALYLARVGDNPTRAYAPDPGLPQVATAPGNPSLAIAANLTPGQGGEAMAAELFFDAPGAEGSGLAGTVSGRRVTWSLPATGLSPGRHSAWVRARDAAGRWGPLNASSFLVGRQSIFLPTGPQRALVTP